MKKSILKKLGGSLLRGLVKQIPFIGNPIVEVVTNLSSPKDQPKKHTNVSVYVQLMVVSMVILDLVLNAGANLKSLLDFIGVMGLLK